MFCLDVVGDKIACGTYDNCFVWSYEWDELLKLDACISVSLGPSSIATVSTNNVLAVWDYGGKLLQKVHKEAF